ncbi:MAG: VWA domain-containing protein, partial [Myxococcota bacterium]
AFELEGERTTGVVRARDVARADYERALLEGRSAALLEEERSSLFTQRVGNVPPRAEVDIELSLDQPLEWVSGAWSFRFPTVVGPRYLGAPGRTPDADRVTVDVAETVDARAQLSLSVDDRLRGPISSRSHVLQVDGSKACFAEGAGVPLDRDLVVEWPVADAVPGAALAAGRAAAVTSEDSFGVLTLVPPALPASAVPRDLCFLIDVSGSMHGPPLAQAKRVLLALIDQLGPEDRLEMVAFASGPERWRNQPTEMNERGRREATRWLKELRSMGCTEMKAGIEEALRTFRASARQLVVVTDGYIGFEAEIVAAVQEKLPASCSVHTLGVGSAVNRSLTEPLARVGRGRELIIAPGEDAEPAAEQLMRATYAPLVTELELTGTAFLEAGRRRLPDLMAGVPALLPLRLRPEGGDVVVSGRTAEGAWSHKVAVPALAAGEGQAFARTLFARERVLDLEAEKAQPQAQRAALDERIEQLGLRFQIATSRTSWVAVSEGATVDSGAPTRSETMPHLLPHEVSAEGFGLSFPPPAQNFLALRQDVGTRRRFGRSARSSLAGASFGGLGPKDEASGQGAEVEDAAPASADEGDAGRPPRPRPRRTRVVRSKLRGERLAGGRRGWVAKVRWMEPGRVVLEVVLPEDTLWPELETVTMDGREVRLIDGTTASGSLRAGEVLRLVLACDVVPKEILTAVARIVVERD